jgi:hypothetical protein
MMFLSAHAPTGRVAHAPPGGTAHARFQDAVACDCVSLDGRGLEQLVTGMFCVQLLEHVTDAAQA